MSSELDKGAVVGCSSSTSSVVVEVCFFFGALGIIDSTAVSCPSVVVEVYFFLGALGIIVSTAVPGLKTDTRPLGAPMWTTVSVTIEW